MQKMIDDSEELSYFEHIGEYVARICDLARSHSVKLHPGYFHIAMALKVMEGVSLSLNKDLELVSKCVPLIAKAEALRAMGIYKFPVPGPDDDFYKSTGTD
jgi:predicted unusual protein kinase regulating ubiquinone biosynthesis (AarF/ABC1/UbiB family)